MTPLPFGRDSRAARRLRGTAGAGSSPHSGPAGGRGPVGDDASVAELADLVAAVSRAGLPPARTWSLVATGSDRHAALATGAAAWAELGLPPGAALLRSAAVLPSAAFPSAASPPAPGSRAGTGSRATTGSRPGTAGPGRPMVALAVALDVCDRAGAGASEVLGGLARAMRAEEAAREDREVALAAPRATATVLAALPVAGVGLGMLLGADPVRVLLGTPVGRLCLVVGAVLWSAGRWWTRRLVEAAAANPP